MILVTGAGGAAGVAVIRSLLARGERVAAVDTDGLAAGLALADERAVIAPAGDSAFLGDLAEAAKRFAADVVLCTVAEEMLAIAGREHVLAEVGAAIWLPPRASVQTCVDKLVFAQALCTHDIATPPTASGAAIDEVPGPWIVKPRFGRGSRDVYAVDDRDELRWALARVCEPIVQSRLSGREFTVDVLIDRGGDIACVVPRWRLETKAGISTKGRTFSDATVETLARATVRALGLRAAVNVQGFAHDDGTAAIVEVNPRVSGGLSLTQAAGADVVGALVRGTRGEAIGTLEFQPGVTMSRHFTEVFS